ncbi:MAG: anti-sigma F factor [Defluviitaleaceae bacterium]|nr:anti-sigma F factor [Defluviitaleaceae bacterium]
MQNIFEMKFLAISQNQAFARVCAAAFAAQLNPTLAELNEVKTAVSEAVTNAMIHGYGAGCDDEKWIYLRCQILDNEIWVEIEDKGMGINDIAAAREPLYTTKPDEERSGMGFTVMEEFMDEVVVHSALGEGTVVKMSKKITQ